MPTDPQDPYGSDMDQDDGDDEFVETEPCPFCGKPVYEQAEICPHCGQYIVDQESSRKKPLWIVVGVAVCLTLILIVWVLNSR